VSANKPDVVRIVRELAARHESLALPDIGAGAVVLAPETVAQLAGAELEASEARALREDLVRWLRSKNQFVSIDEDTEAEIEAALTRLASEVGEGALEDAQDALDDALDGLASVIRESLGEAPREVVVSEYAPDLQLAVLGLKLSDVVSPVLDVGCGANALLVRHLRALGHDVIGIDRDAPEDATRTDWIKYEYGNAKWKTVLSHLGFSLHFLRAHHASESDARIYAETYLRITRSLTVGGLFAYAPSLPFFESVLPKDRFVIEHQRVRGGETLASLRKTSGLDLAEATRVRRLA
jgi:hypothetical protein